MLLGKLDSDGAEHFSARIFHNLKFLEPPFQFVRQQPHGKPDRPQCGEVVQRGATNAKPKL